ncbi:hypothetical protein [Spirillospora sp. NPDC029432]|uniref:hypothetical protein n=1 Tax=Spirillospora sp. NPDC029432 TaxID=3154599 RepID=UPI0034537DB9
MGGSNWDYVVPYQPDIDAALAMAHEYAFSQGDYFWPFDSKSRFSAGPERPRPGSIRELWEDPVVQELLTHSVLDLFTVAGPAEEPEILQAAPLSSAATLELFGTERPSRADYDRARDRLWNEIRNGYGHYVTLYHDGTPEQIAFFGVTGD